MLHITCGVGGSNAVEVSTLQLTHFAVTTSHHRQQLALLGKRAAVRVNTFVAAVLFGSLVFPRLQCQDVASLPWVRGHPLLSKILGSGIAGGRGIA